MNAVFGAIGKLKTDVNASRALVNSEFPIDEKPDFRIQYHH